MVLEVYDGVEPVAATSARFAVRVRQEVGRVRSPHVYVTLSPDAQLEQVHPPNFCALHGGCLCNRSMSWAEFGQRPEDTAYVKVTRLDGHVFSPHTRVLPRSARVRVDTFLDGGRTIVFPVKGARRHLLLYHGDAPSCDP